MQRFPTSVVGVDYCMLRRANQLRGLVAAAVFESTIGADRIFAAPYRRHWKPTLGAGSDRDRVAPLLRRSLFLAVHVG
jgi:hypothetical protein